MAAEILPEIGTKNGPCFSCNHSDCRAIRQMASVICPYCHETIGYSTRFYETDEFGLVHASCYEDAVEQALAQPTGAYGAIYNQPRDTRASG